MNKRGQGISIETIIAIAIGLVVLVVIVLFFTGTFKTLIPKTQNLINADAGAKQIWRNVCETSCPSQNYCEINYRVDHENDGEIDEIYICSSKAEKKVKEILKKENVNWNKIISLDVPCEIEC